MSDAEKYIEMLAGQFKRFSIHRKLLFGSGDIAIPGSVFTNSQEAARVALFWASKGHDIFLAQGEQENIGKTEGRRYPQAIRKRYNIVNCSALYLDLDVKENAYTSQEEALEAFNNFLIKNNLPQPSMIVSSGTGGLHIYFVASENFSPVEHEALSASLIGMADADGLKFDRECTKDLCRLLRVPETWNFKTDPASPVTLLHAGKKITLEVLREKFKVVVNVVPIKPGTTFNVDDNDDLQRPRREYKLADFNEVATFCAFLHDTSMTGGANHSEAIWKQTVSLASYCKDGRELAHTLSKGHGAYTFEETELKYDQVETDKKNNPKLGPTKCATLKTMGVTDCDLCPYFKLNTSPINVPNFNPKPASTPSHNPNSDLPKGYTRDKDNTIWTQVVDTSSGENKDSQVFPYALIYNSAFAEGHGEEYNFCFTTLEGNNHTKLVKIPMSSAISRDRLLLAFAKNGLPMNYHEGIRKFIVALQSLLRNRDETLVSVSPLGWHKLSNGVTGFSYDNNFYSPGKTVRAQELDPELARAYRAAGDGKYWRELSELIIAQNRPDLNVLIACGFAAPLMALTGHFGVSVGGWSSKTGAGKSTALSLCQAIWGSTIQMRGLDDTANQVMDTLATLKNLPLCWDEIRGSVQTEKMVKVIDLITRGREKGRLNREAKQMQQREFESLLVWAANNPLADEIAKASRGTGAGYSRVFEFNVDDTFVSNLNVGHISNLTGQLRKNYGHIGTEYAKFLGNNHAKVLQWVTSMRDKIDDDLKTTQSERYWATAAACIIVGARLSNALKFTKFDLPTMEQFIYEKIRGFRTVVGAVATNDFSRADNVELMLGEFLHAMTMNTLKTDTMPTGAGRPAKGQIKILNDNLTFTRQTVVVQLSEKERICKISDTALSRWTRDKEITKSSFTTALQKHFKAKATRSRIASGTEYVSVPMLVWEIDLSQTALGQEIEF